MLGKKIKKASRKNRGEDGSRRTLATIRGC
jgi:hypothetical protein